MTGDWRETAPLRMEPGRVRLGCRPLPGGPLRAALAAAGLTSAVALLSTPAEYLVGWIGADGAWAGPDGTSGIVGRLDDAFEARVFTAGAELRWVRRGDGGQAVLVGEDLPGDPAPVEAEVIESCYLLWGEPDSRASAPDGWQALSAGRIGLLRVPVTRGAPVTRDAGRRDPGTRLRLRVREYVGHDDYGNAHVLDERLYAIEAAPVVLSMREPLRLEA